MTAAVREISNRVAQAGQLAQRRPVTGYLRSATQLAGESLRNQLDAVLRYARNRDMQLVRIYCDECGSGLRIDNRPGLGQLLRDLDRGDGDFEAVLLLDRSRWSRLLNPEHVRFMEERCGAAGVEVHYCAEDLYDDETSISAILKVVRRHVDCDDPCDPSGLGQPRAPLRKATITASMYRSTVDRRDGRNTAPDAACDADHVRPGSE